MSQAGVKHELSEVPNAQLARPSGRYTIEDEQPATLPPPQASQVATASALPLLGINALSAEELRWIEARTNHPNTDPPRGLTSAVFAKEGEDPTFGALQPFYREPTLERVQLQFADLSLDPSHNPLARSSLLPPPRAAMGITRALAIGVGALALSSVGYLAVIASWGGPGTATTVFLPARMAKAPHVLTLVPPQEAPVSFAAAVTGGEEVPASIADEVPWSTSVESNAQASTAPAADATAAGALSPGWKQRRLAAWRARVAAIRGASAAPEVVPLALPAQPTREQIKLGLDGVRSMLQSCAASLHGTSTARVTIASAGRVASASIEGAFAGTPEGSCMARALRNAVVPRFSGPNLQVSYPFRL
jgi:hypothetical protein